MIQHPNLGEVKTMKNKLFRKGIVVGIIILFFGANGIQSNDKITLQNYGQPDTVYVDDDFNESTPGWGYDHFDNIRDGITVMNESGTVYVFNGTYTEDLGPNLEYVRIEKSLNLFGESREHTIINCPSGDTGVWINTAHFNISGFTVVGANNPIQIGIYGQVGCNNVRIEDCIIHSFGEGIAFRYNTHNITITNCIAYDNTRNGGIALHENQENGIKDFEISRCTCYSNSNGIYIVNNSLNGIIYHNNLFNNSFNAVDNSGHIWNKSYPTCGNFWGDYGGDDLYSGPNQDVPGPDGIGDIPYEIPCEHGIDYYPLMNPFEQYHMLYISAPPEVDEGELFNVVVTSIGGPVVPDVAVGFNDEFKLTDSDGRVYFTAPQVGEDTYYEITATKEGYTGDNESILIEDKLIFFKYAFLLGRLDNLITEEEIITFEAVNIRAITFFPFTYNHYKSKELITISKYYFGLVGARFIAAFCGLSYRPSIISMNILSWDNISNKIVWLVSGVKGNPIGINDVETILINKTGQPQPDAEITFNDTTDPGRISPGDTFTVIAPSDGNYTFLLTHKLTGETVFKSVLTHY